MLLDGDDEPPQAPPRVLIIDDDERLNALLTDYPGRQFLSTTSRAWARRANRSNGYQISMDSVARCVATAGCNAELGPALLCHIT
jgi:hypothetical protein